MYSGSFGTSLLSMTLITTLIILVITSNVILSLGMVGALSIVRFRTAIKEPMDIAFSILVNQCWYCFRCWTHTTCCIWFSIYWCNYDNIYK